MAQPHYSTFKRQVRLGSGQSLHFTPGHGYYAAPRVKTLLAAPSKPKVAKPKPPSDLQLAQQQIDAIYGPQRQQLTSLYGQRSQDAAHAIQGATSALAALMGQYGPAVQQAYSTSLASQSAIDSALADRLQGVGNQKADELSATLAKADQDPGFAAQLAGQTQQIGSGAANAGYAYDAADLTKLVGQKAAAADYASKLPGIAGLYGLQSTRQAEGQISSELADALSSLASQEPQAVQSALSQIQDNAAKANQQAIENAIAEKTLGINLIKARASITQGNQKVKIAGRNATTAAAKVRNAQAAASRPNADLSKAYGYIVDANGNPILRNGKRIPVAKTPKTPKKPSVTPAQANTLAEDFYFGIAPTTRADGSVAKPGVPPVPYPKAMLRLIALGLSRAQAQAILNTYYGPGEGGRPRVPFKPVTVGPTGSFGVQAAIPGGS